MNVFKKVVLSGTPRERGVTYGRECAALIERTISDYTRYFDNKKNQSCCALKDPTTAELRMNVPASA